MAVFTGLGSAASPSITFSADTNTGIFSPGADQVAISTNGSNRLHITSAGNVGIGTTSPTTYLVVASPNSNTAETVAGFGNQTIGTGLEIRTNGDLEWGFNAVNTRNLTFSTDQLERARIDSAGRLLVGANTSFSQFNGIEPYAQITGLNGTLASLGLLTFSTNAASAPVLLIGHSKGATVGTYTATVTGDDLGGIAFSAANGTGMFAGGRIRASASGNWSSISCPGILSFSTTSVNDTNPTERVWINELGSVLINTSGAAPTNAQSGVQLRGDNSGTNIFSSGALTTSWAHMTFINGNGTVGNIVTSGSATAYNISSDYRLKENVVDLDGAIDRLKQLPVRRFNFITDSDTVVDGFIAHEAAEVVPECVTGAKDEVDEDGNPVYQGIDHSKLVPLLTAALQEAIVRIELLEAEVTALKA